MVYSSLRLGRNEAKYGGEPHPGRTWLHGDLARYRALNGLVPCPLRAR